MKRVLMFVLLGGFAAIAFAATNLENRAIFDEGFTWTTKSGADETLRKIKAAGFNIFVPCVWHGNGTTWPSSTGAPRDPHWKDPGSSDPLKYLITQAHAMGIEVHPWFTVVRREGGLFPSFAEPGTPADAFDVHNSKFGRFITSIILEVLRNYDVDGINLDYVRAMGICTSSSCQADYKRQYSAELLADQEAAKHSKPAWSRIAAWNQTPIETVVKDVSVRAHSSKPKVIVSIDSRAGADWVRLEGGNSIDWANKGYLDVIFDMDYGNPIDAAAFAKAAALSQNAGKLVILVGNYEVRPGAKAPWTKNDVYPRKAGAVVDLIKTARQLAGTNGVALYEIRFLTQEQSQMLRSGPFNQDARPSWKLFRSTTNLVF